MAMQYFLVAVALLSVLTGYKKMYDVNTSDGG